MAYLIAGSDGLLSFTCSTTPDTYTITLTDADGATVTTGAESLAGDTVSAIVASADVPASAVGEMWTASITWTKDGQTRTDTWHLDIRADDRDLLPALKAELNIPDTTDDSMLRSLLAQAEAAITTRYTLATVPAQTDTRTVFADGCVVFLAECASVTAVSDLDGNALTYTSIPNATGVGAVTLDSAHVGYVRVTGTFGYDDIPADEKRAIVIQASVYYRRKTYGTDDAPYRGGGAALAPEVEQLMSARRVV